MNTFKLFFATLAASVMATSAGADIVTVDFASDELTGRFTYDTSLAASNLYDFGGGKAATYTPASDFTVASPTRTLTLPFRINVFDSMLNEQGVRRDVFVVSAAEPGQDVVLNLSLSFDDLRLASPILTGDIGGADPTLLFFITGTGDSLSLTNPRYTFSVSPAAIPEPASWAMMIGGFGIAGAALRRRTATRPVAALA